MGARKDWSEQQQKEGEELRGGSKGRSGHATKSFQCGERVGNLTVGNHQPAKCLHMVLTNLDARGYILSLLGVVSKHMPLERWGCVFIYHSSNRTQTSAWHTAGNQNMSVGWIHYFMNKYRDEGTDNKLHSRPRMEMTVLACLSKHLTAGCLSPLVFVCLGRPEMGP